MQLGKNNYQKNTMSKDLAPIVAFENVSFAYINSQQVILKNINAKFFSHEIYFLTGESGAGKTSFLKLIYGALQPTSGNISVLQTNTQDLNTQTMPIFRQQMGIVQQECELFEHLNVIDNVALVLKLQDVHPKKANAYAEELLAWVGLGDYLKRYPKELSDGQKQRVSIARAVIRRPKLLLADEPTGNVDDNQSKRLINLFQELAKMGTSVIIATHNRQLVASKGNGEYRLRHGEIYHQNALKGSSSLTAKLMRMA